MWNEKKSLAKWVFIGSLFFIFLCVPASRSNANSLMSVSMCSSIDTITQGDTTQPVISWTSSGADRGSCTVSANLPAPAVITVPGGACTVVRQFIFSSYSCSNGATPRVTGGFGWFGGICSCPAVSYSASSQSAVTLPTPAATTTYSVNCRRAGADGRGGYYSNTACATVTVKPFVCPQNCMPANEVCLGTPYNDTNCNKYCGIGTKPVTFDNNTYECTANSDNCTTATCGQIYPLNPICSATRQCRAADGSYQKDYTLGAVACESHGTSCPTDAICRGCLLQANGWTEIQPQ